MYAYICIYSAAAQVLEMEFGNDCTFLRSKVARINRWEKVTVGDFVIFSCNGRFGAGSVEFHASVEHDGDVTAISCVRAFERISVGPRSSEWRKLDARPTLLLTSEILYACIRSKVGTAKLLRPLSMMH